MKTEVSPLNSKRDKLEFDRVRGCRVTLC